jgi:hypothetical protein
LTEKRGEITMDMTKHAKTRQQQRGIPPIVVDLLLDYGTEVRAPGQQVTKRYFDKPARRRLRIYAGRLAHLLEEYLDYYAVISNDGKVITVAPLVKRVKQDIDRRRH